MAKNMARIEDGMVVNIEWCPNATEETECLKETNGITVEIGDSYDGSWYYRDGERLYSPIELAQHRIFELQKENASLIECILEMSEVVYA